MLPAGTIRHRFTAEEYRKMGEVGILREDDRVELIGGEIVEMNPIGTRHLACVVALNHLLVALSGGRYFVSVQNPISVGVGDEPQPDLSLLKERPSPDAETPPGPGDILLVVEVSDSTLAYDRNVKLPLYASVGIPEVWLVDLRGEKVEVFTDTEGDRYAGRRAYVRGDEVRSETLPDLTLPVTEILG
jgi:Uma2 family endonuclease